MLGVRSGAGRCLGRLDLLARGGTTDAFGRQLAPLTDGLGFLPYANGVHYDAEERRRPVLHELIGNGTFGTGYATDNGVGIHYRDTGPVEAVADRLGRYAYRVERKSDGTVSETRIPPRLL